MTSIKSAQPFRWIIFLDELKRLKLPTHELASEEFEFLSQKFGEMRNRSKSEFKDLIDVLKHEDPDNPAFLTFSLFGVLHGTGLRETAHTRSLAWMFNPKQSLNGHGLPEKLFLSVLDKFRDKVSPEWPKGEYQVDKVIAEKRTKKGRRIDIWVEGRVTTNGAIKFWLVVIEAKLETSLSDQLIFYEMEAKQWSEEKGAEMALEPCFVYLKDGTSIDLEANHENKWIPLSFTDLFDSIWPIVRGYPKAAGYHMVRFYLAGILKDVARWPLPLGEAVSYVNYHALISARSLSIRLNKGEQT